MKFFLLLFLIVLHSKSAYSQADLSNEKRDSVINALWEKNKITSTDTLHFKNFVKDINISLLSTTDTCNKAQLYIVNLPKAHSERFFFVSDENGITLLDFDDVADLLTYLGGLLSNKCSVSQKEKLLICDYLLDAQKNRGKSYRY